MPKLEGTKPQIIGIRMNELDLFKLDTLVKECKYKSRTDCLKSLLDERYAQHKANGELIATIKEIVQTDEDIKAYFVKLIGELAAEK